jgi:hypothetical protein
MAEPAVALQSLRTNVINWRAEAEKKGRELLVATARAGHAKIMRDQPDSTWIAFGDVPGRDWTQAERMITFKYSPALSLVAPVIIRMLEDGSPVDSGLYKRSHMLFVNGQATAEGAKIPAGAAVMIANPVPYARRLEIGKTESGRNFLVSKPNRLYERTARAAANRWPTVEIRFGYVALPGNVTSKGHVGRTSKNARRRRRAERNRGTTVASPAIFIGRRA